MVFDCIVAATTAKSNWIPGLNVPINFTIRLLSALPTIFAVQAPSATIVGRVIIGPARGPVVDSA